MPIKSANALVNPTESKRRHYADLVRCRHYTRAQLVELGVWPLRHQHAVIRDLRMLKECLRVGSSTELGGYPIFFVTADSEPLSYEAVRENFRQIVSDMNEHEFAGPQWRVVACEVNWEDAELRCSHTNELIPSAYGEHE